MEIWVKLQRTDLDTAENQAVINAGKFKHTYSSHSLMLLFTKYCLANH